MVALLKGNDSVLKVLKEECSWVSVSLLFKIDSLVLIVDCSSISFDGCLNRTIGCNDCKCFVVA